MPPVTSTSQQNRLEYLTGMMTRKAISRQAGISLHRLRRLEREGLALPANELKRFVNLSRRISYTDLRKAGFSTAQSRRFRNSSVESIHDLKRRIGAIQDHLSTGAYAAMKASKEKQGVVFNDTVLRREAEQAVFDGLQKSKKTIEDWENY